MKKRNLILSAALAAIFSSSVVFAEAEVTGKLVHERAQLTSGTKDVIKSETTVRIYIDGEAEGIAEGATYHVELQGYTDDKANHSSDAAYTQRDPLREAYVDMELGDWSIRAGKQQVVWGTADGMKLLDMINPTDYAEMAQNQMEDSRIPVWMINAEKDNLQIVISQAKENVFAGLNRGTDTAVRSNGTIPAGQMLATDTPNVGTDTDSAFLMMGPETITGATNGFLNITPDLGSVAAGFGTAFMPMSTDPTTQAGLGGMVYSGMPDDVSTLYVNEGYMDGMSDLLSAFTVDGFTVMRDPATGATFDNAINATGMPGSDGIADSTTLQGLSDMFVGMQLGKAYANGTYAGTEADFLTTYVYPAGSVAPDGVTSIAGQPMAMQFRDLNFASMVVGMGCQEGDTAACTAVMSGVPADTQNYFDGMAAGMTGEMALNGFGSQYGSNLSSFGDGNANSAFEYMTDTGFRTFDTFVNARSQYKYNMPSDSDVNLAFRTQESTAGGVNYSLNYSYNYDTNPIIDLSWRNDAGEVLTQTVVDAPLTMATPDGMVTIPGTYIALTDSQGMPYGGGASAGMQTDRSAILTFEQQVKRVNNIGGSFDTSIETAALGPVVIRGEALYTKGGYAPIMSKTKLSGGDLVGALQMKKADRMKLVLGADITAMTNMLISAQFIQISNLDFIDSETEYTTDYATMHLSNGFQKGTKDKNFYSLFFSKPFGASGEHRWNNITMLEEGVGENAIWNRFDIEYSIDDDTQATFEYNNYSGNVNTQFAQFGSKRPSGASSTIQVGVKYSF